MTALELIHQLQTLPPETKIVVRGYEDGYNDILKPRQVKIELRKKQAWFYGEYRDSEKGRAIIAIDLFSENTKAED